MRRTAGIVLAVIMAAAFALWLRLPPSQVSSNMSGAAEASSSAIFPNELHRNAGKNLPDHTVREPF
jgi:hypothetical protein